MRLRLRPGSAVVKNGGVKVIKGEGFPNPEISATYATDQNRDGERSRGDLNVSFRVMSRLESRARFVLKTYVTLYRTRFVCRLGSWVLLGYGALWFTVRVLEWALDLDDAFVSRGRVPDAALLHNFPGAYGLLGGKENQIFYPRFRVPEQIINDWVPTGLGACAAKMGMTAEGPWARRAGK
jgi:hypothetical protein